MGSLCRLVGVIGLVLTSGWKNFWFWIGFSTRPFNLRLPELCFFLDRGDFQNPGAGIGFFNPNQDLITRHEITARIGCHIHF
jgi:hypothetical protein